VDGSVATRVNRTPGTVTSSIPTMPKPSPLVASTVTRTESARTGSGGTNAAAPDGPTVTSACWSPTSIRTRLICTAPGRTATETFGTVLAANRNVSDCPTARSKSPNSQAVRGSPSAAFSGLAAAIGPNAEPVSVAVADPPVTVSVVWPPAGPSARVPPGSAVAGSSGPVPFASRPGTVVRRRLVSVSTIRAVSGSTWASSAGDRSAR
jgi:hypothetical protein